MPLIDDIVLEFDVIQAKYYDILPCNNAKIPYLSTSPFNEHLVSFLEPGSVSRWAHS